MIATVDDRILRPDENGEPDDICITSDYFRMERLDDDSWWIAAHRGQGRAMFYLTIDDENPRRIHCTYVDDGITLTDDGGNNLVNGLMTGEDDDEPDN